MNLAQESLKENLIDCMLNIERLLYYVNNLKNIEPKLKQKFEIAEAKFKKIRGNYIELFKEETNIKSTEEFCQEFIKSNDKNEIQKLFKLIYELSNMCLNIINFNELRQEKIEILKSLSYILTKEEIIRHEKNIDELFKNLDIEKIKAYLTELQEIILKDFASKITDINQYKKGQAFRLLCHSVDYTEYDKNKQEKFTAASLLTQEHTNTYRSGYGFIMKPDKILCASSKDQNTDITAKDKETITDRIMPRIDAIEKIEKECKDYSEVLLEGFNPIGIFCLTDGSKTLNLNYLKALKLKESFQDLKIIDIDLTLYKQDLTEIKNSLVNHINAYLGKYEEDNYDKYEEFFEKYLELKSKKELTEEEIISLFNEYQNQNKR